MTVEGVARHKTALSRGALSRPMATALADGLLPRGSTVFDYGCGKGDDLRHLRALGYPAEGWDPAYLPDAHPRPSAIVNIGYVVNVIEHPTERAETLRRAWALAEHLLVISARMTWDAREISGHPMGDGMLTRRGTFQKFYDHLELAGWIQRTLGVKPHAAAPGIFYAFRDEASAQRFIASRVYSYRPRVAIDPHAQYEQHKQTLAPLLTFMQVHGRTPRQGELADHEALAIKNAMGSIGTGQRLIRSVTEADYWSQVTVHRRAELLIYVALSRFRRRATFSQLDRSLAIDLRTLFGTYREACLEADRLLLACGDQAMRYVNARGSKVGKQTPSSLYIHRSAMAEIPPVLQVYEGCARVLAGTIPTANLIKLSIAEAQVSYLTYPNFDRDPHPILHSAITVNLSTLSVTLRDYSRSDNPPLLHRKEEFVGVNHPQRARYEQLTRSEVRAGLYEYPEQIGTLKGWRATLERAGVHFRGHRLVRT
jgi:DNA phosphorothioation-associated putative methyltransferase